MADILEKAELYLPPKFLQAIGNLAAHWAYLESAAEIIIWGFLGVPRKVGAAITTHMGMVSRIQALTILSERALSEESPAILAVFKKRLVQITELQTKRNNLIHNLWQYEPNSDATCVSALKITAKGKFRETWIHISIDEINQTVDEIRTRIVDLQAFAEVTFPDAHLPWRSTDDEGNDED
jgi:hypothetical protein